MQQARTIFNYFLLLTLTNALFVSVAKQLKKKENEEVVFDKNLTVFKDWKPPTEKDLQAMFKHDVQYWKMPKFIKEEKQVSNTSLP